MANNEKTDVVRIGQAVSDALLVDYIKETDFVKRIAIKVNEEDLKKWVGNYRLRDGIVVQVILEIDKLFLLSVGSERFQLFAESSTKFFVKEFDTQIKFTADANGKPVQLTIIQGDELQKGTLLDSNAIPTIAPAPLLLVGSYHHPRLGITYQIILEDDKVILKLPLTFKKYLDISQAKLTSMGGDIYNTERLGVIEFARNEKNEISGFKFNDVGRLRDIRFLKIK